MLLETNASFADLAIAPADFSSVLGVERSDEHMLAELHETLRAAAPAIQARALLAVYSTVTLGKTSLTVGATTLRCGAKICRQLAHTEQLAVFVCTVGNGIGALYRTYTQHDNPLRAYFADCLGSIAVEKAMNLFQQQLAERLQAQGLRTTNRYSPGYCTWNTEEQRQLFSLLPPKPCGVALSPSQLMVPAKSISGVIGIGSEVRFTEHNCGLCELKTCSFRQKRAG